MWKVLLYVRNDQSVPIVDFLDSILDVKLHAKILHEIGLLEEFGNQLRFPHTQSILDHRGSLFELRVQQSSNIARVLFFFVKGKRIILLHGFVKKTQKTPSSEIDLAFQYKYDYQSRGEEDEKQTI